MNAKEARTKTDQANRMLAEAEFNLCMAKIEEAINQGKYFVDIPDQNFFYPSTIKKLQEMGYKVKGGCRILWAREK